MKGPLVAYSPSVQVENYCLDLENDVGNWLCCGVKGLGERAATLIPGGFLPEGSAEPAGAKTVSAKEYGFWGDNSCPFFILGGNAHSLHLGTMCCVFTTCQLVRLNLGRNLVSFAPSIMPIIQTSEPKDRHFRSRLVTQRLSLRAGVPVLESSSSTNPLIGAVYSPQKTLQR